MNQKPAVVKNFVFDWVLCFRLCEVYRFQNLVGLELPIKHALRLALWFFILAKVPRHVYSTARKTFQHNFDSPSYLVQDFSHVLKVSLKEQGHVTVNKPVISRIYIVAHTWPLRSAQILVDQGPRSDPKSGWARQQASSECNMGGRGLHPPKNYRIKLTGLPENALFIKNIKKPSPS